MKKVRFSAIVSLIVLLSACSGGGSDKTGGIHLSPVRGVVFEYTPGSGEHTPSYFKDLDEFVKLEGYSVSLEFVPAGGGLGSVRQTAADKNGKADPYAWAVLDFPVSLFEKDGQGIYRAKQVKNFNMQGAGKSYIGTNEAEVVLGGSAVGLSYSDFGYLAQSVKGLFSNKNAGIANQEKSLSEFMSFQTGMESNKISESDWQAVIDRPVEFKGLAFAAVAGSPGGVSASGGDLVGDAVLELDTQGRVSLDLDFSRNNAGVWNFANDGTGYKASVNGTALDTGAAGVSFDVFGMPAAENTAANPHEAIGRFDYTVDNDNWIAGNFGVKRN